MFLFSLGRHGLLWTFLSRLHSLCSIGFGLLGVHFHFFPGTLCFLSWCCCLPIHCFKNMLYSFHEFGCFCDFSFRFLPSFKPLWSRKCLTCFQFSWKHWGFFVSYHVVYVWKCSMCIWKECIFYFFGMKGSIYYQLSPFDIGHCLGLHNPCSCFVWKIYQLFTVGC